MKYYIESLESLVDVFEKLPGIGRKTAQRLAFFVVGQDKSYSESFSNALINAKNSIKNCKVCHSLTDKDICEICSDDTRDKKTICVIEGFKDVMAFERISEYNGVYHVLNGLISPMNGIGIEDLTISQLLNRISEFDVKEVIMATNPTVEGETTSMYISKLLKPFDLKVTRLAYGIPVGGNLEFADEITLFKALEGRNLM